MILMMVCSILHEVRSFGHAAQQEATDTTTKESNTSIPLENSLPSKERSESSASTIVKNTRVNLSYYFDSWDFNTMNVLVNSTALP